jgi:hypothetical protein
MKSNKSAYLDLMVRLGGAFIMKIYTGTPKRSLLNVKNRFVYLSIKLNSTEFQLLSTQHSRYLLPYPGVLFRSKHV